MGMPTDPIYRDSAMALQGMRGEVLLSWMADLLTIRTLPEKPFDPRAKRS